MEDVFKSVTGPEPYRVYQRSKNNTASIQIAGELIDGTDGVAEARLARGKDSITLFNWKALKTDGLSFSGALEDVPVGGPYTLELRVKKGRKISTTHSIPGILVGDLWILAGQSNMDGCGKLVDLESPSKHVHCFYYGDTWEIARDPLCWLNESIDPVHWASRDPEEHANAIKWDRAFRTVGAGLGVRFGKDMYRVTSVPVGLLMCSHGGTSMEQWSPALKGQGGESLYGCMIRRVKAAGGKVAGCLWYQGESDALGTGGKDYREIFGGFIRSVRSDLKQPDMPFIYVQLATFYSWEPVADGWNKVQNDQLLVEKDLKNVALAAAIDSTLSDAIHVDAISQRRLGARLARLARKLVFGEKIEAGPRPKDVQFADDQRKEILVSFESVNGSLTPPANIWGFSVEKDGMPLGISKCKLQRGGRSVLITLASPAPEAVDVWYGRGVNPCCNLKDRADFPVPVFGPVRV